MAKNSSLKNTDSEDKHVFTDFKCEMARKHGHEFRKMFRSCNEFHQALCEHYTKPSNIVTTVEYREDSKIYKSIFVQPPTDTEGKYPTEGKIQEYYKDQNIVWASSSLAVGIMFLFLCAGLLIYCKRKKITINSIYDTIHIRPRGRNPYAHHVPNGLATPMTEETNVLVQPSTPARNEQPPPRVDSIQTLASSSSFATDSTSPSYVEDVRYYRNFSYETPPSVATSQPPRVETQPNTPSLSGRLYCSSCRRHRRKRDFQRTSSNCTSCSSQYFTYSQPSRPGQRNLSQDTTNTNSICSQWSSKDTNDTRSERSSRSHRSGPSDRVLSKLSRYRSQADHMSVEQTTTPVCSAASQVDDRISNSDVKKNDIVDRVCYSSGLRLVKKMFSIDLK